MPFNINTKYILCTDFKFVILKLKIFILITNVYTHYVAFSLRGRDKDLLATLISVSENIKLQ